MAPAVKTQTLSAESTEPDLIDRIANALPDNVRAEYYRELRHCRSLPENDEMLRLLRAMQFLTLLMIKVPTEVTAERERLESVFDSAMRKVQENLRSWLSYQKLLDERLICLPDQIKSGVNPEIIAGKINESLRQQFVRSTIPQTAESLRLAAEQMKTTTAEFGRTAGILTDSYRGVAAQASQSIDEMTSSIRNAAETAGTTARELSDTFRHEYRWALYALSSLALMLGIGIGMLFQRWLDRSPQEEPEIQQLLPVPETPPIHIPKKH